MAKEDSIRKKVYEEIAEAAGVHVRTLQLFVGESDNPLSLARRKISHLLAFGQLMKEASWVSEDFCIGKETIENWAAIIRDMSREVIYYLDEWDKAFAEYEKRQAQAEKEEQEAPKPEPEFPAPLKLIDPADINLLVPFTAILAHKDLLGPGRFEALTSLLTEAHQEIEARQEGQGGAA